jgi:DNA repair photolyase
MSTPIRTQRKGRGALSAPTGRFEARTIEAVDDGWGNLDEALPALNTTLEADRARSVIARNRSPDVPFDRSINPYRGCEHGCVYCFARPTHAYAGLSPGQDFEARLFYKADAARHLEAELRAPGYEPAPLTLGANTDPYQPVERQQRVTRDILEVLTAWRHPVSIVTKGALVERDLDLLTTLAEDNAVSVMVSLTSLDAGLKRSLEPRAAAPHRRLRTIERLRAAGIPVGTLVAPVIPALTEHEFEHLLHAAADAGAQTASYVLLRLPHEVEDLFIEWLRHAYPERAERVLAHLRAAHGGAHYDARFGHRMRGSGAYADLLAQRFAVACRKAGLACERRLALSTAAFQPPPRRGDQFALL